MSCRNRTKFMSVQPPLLAILVAALLAACGTPGTRPASSGTIAHAPLAVSELGNEIALYALGLIDTGYRFGGKNPEAGLDCSGMVSYIYERAAGIKVPGSAADIARRGKAIERTALRPGDLVFFNTRNRSFSHVGIYLGDDRFVHAPSTNGRVRIDALGDRYYAQRFEAARTFFD
ncbi:MAG: NlpC/P60 family protein [Dechloromonas sp.]|nr:MAG: NlpC/P60 family protein [Dechloromonas sp.]